MIRLNFVAVLYALYGFAQCEVVRAAAVSAATADEAIRPISFNPVFIRGGDGQSTDLSRFAQGDSIVPGTYSMDVYINQRWVGRQDIQVLAGPDRPTYCFDRRQWLQWGIDVSRLNDATRQALSSVLSEDACIDLEHWIPEARLDMSMGELRADISIPQAYMQQQPRGFVAPENWDDGITAGFVSYNANTFSNDYAGKRSTQQYVGLNAGINIGGWRLRHNGSYMRSNANGGDYHAISSYLQHDVTLWQSQFTAGEYYTPSELFDGLPFTGIQLSSDERMLPDSQRGFAPAIHGMAETNAKVTVRQGSNVLYETTVAPGPFLIDDLYNTGYAGDLEVTVTEADGRARSFTVPYASLAQLLRPGNRRYSLTAGRYRDDNLRDVPNFIQATYRHGLSNAVTAYGGTIIADRYASVQGGLAFSTRWGALAVDTTLSRASALERSDGMDSSLRGKSYRLTYSKLLQSTQTHFTVAAYRFSSEDYLDLKDFAELRGGSHRAYREGYRFGDPYRNALYRERNRFHLNINQPLPGNGGSLYFSGSAYDYWDGRKRNLTYQAGYNKGFDWGNLTFSAMRFRDGYGEFDTQYMTSVSIPLGRSENRPYLTGSITYRDARNHSLQTALSGYAGNDRLLNYNVYGNANHACGDGDNNIGGSLTYHSPYAMLGAGYSDGRDYRQANLNARGSIVVHRGNVTFSPEQGETMAIIEANGAEGARIANNLGARVDGRGYALIAGLMPYRENDVSLDPKGIAETVALQISSQLVAPRYGAIVYLQYPTLIGNPVLFRIARSDSLSLPIGAEVQDADGNSRAMVGQGGLAFLRGLEPMGRLLIKWGADEDQQCVVDYRLPAETTADRGYLPVSVTCVVPKKVNG